MTFELVDLEDLGENALRDFTQTISVPSGAGDGFGAALNSLVAKVEFTYALAAKLAHREPTMEGTPAIWAKTVAICDQIAVQIRLLEKQHPGNKASFDRI